MASTPNAERLTARRVAAATGLVSPPPRWQSGSGVSVSTIRRRIEEAGLRSDRTGSAMIVDHLGMVVSYRHRPVR